MKLLALTLLGLVVVAFAKPSAAQSADSADNGFGKPIYGGPWFRLKCAFFGCQLCTGDDECSNYDSDYRGPVPLIGGAVHSIECHYGGCEICTRVASTGQPPRCLGYSPSRPEEGEEKHPGQQAPLGAAAASAPDHPTGLIMPWFDAKCGAAGCRVCVRRRCSFYNGAQPFPRPGAATVHLSCSLGTCFPCYNNLCNGLQPVNSADAEPPAQLRLQQPLLGEGAPFLPPPPGTIVYSSFCGATGCKVCVRGKCTFEKKPFPAAPFGAISWIDCNYLVCTQCVNGHCSSTPNPFEKQ